MVNRLCFKLQKAGLVNIVMMEPDNSGVAPALDTDELTIGNIFHKIENEGNNNYIPRFDDIYSTTINTLDAWFKKCYQELNDIPLKDLPIPEINTGE